MACDCEVCCDNALNAERYRKIRALLESSRKVTMGVGFFSAHYYIDVYPGFGRYQGLTFEEMVDSLPSSLSSNNSILRLG